MTSYRGVWDKWHRCCFSLGWDLLQSSPTLFLKSLGFWPARMPLPACCTSETKMLIQWELRRSLSVADQNSKRTAGTASWQWFTKCWIQAARISTVFMLLQFYPAHPCAMMWVLPCRLSIRDSIWILVSNVDPMSLDYFQLPVFFHRPPRARLLFIDLWWSLGVC